MATKVESYMLNPLGGVTRIWDGAAIPDDVGNADWQRYLAWVAEGNTPEPFAGAAMAIVPPPAAAQTETPKS